MSRDDLQGGLRPRYEILPLSCHQERDGKPLSDQERRDQWYEAHCQVMGELFERGLLKVTT